MSIELTRNQTIVFQTSRMAGFLQNSTLDFEACDDPTFRTFCALSRLRQEEATCKIQSFTKRTIKELACSAEVRKIKKLFWEIIAPKITYYKAAICRFHGTSLQSNPHYAKEHFYDETFDLSFAFNLSTLTPIECSIVTKFLNKLTCTVIKAENLGFWEIVKQFSMEKRDREELFSKTLVAMRLRQDMVKNPSLSFEASYAHFLSILALVAGEEGEQYLDDRTSFCYAGQFLSIEPLLCNAFSPLFEEISPQNIVEIFREKSALFTKENIRLLIDIIDHRGEAASEEVQYQLSKVSKDISSEAFHSLLQQIYEDQNPRAGAGDSP